MAVLGGCGTTWAERLQAGFEPQPALKLYDEWECAGRVGAQGALGTAVGGDRSTCSVSSIGRASDL